MSDLFIPIKGNASTFDDDWHETLLLRAMLINRHMHIDLKYIGEVEAKAAIEVLTSKLCEMSH